MNRRILVASVVSLLPFLVVSAGRADEPTTAAGQENMRASTVAQPPAPASAPKVVIYTKDNPPKTPALEDLPLKESVSQYGITWTFAEPARVGQFVNGDYYVVGPVTVKMIDQKPLWGDEVKELSLIHI